MPVSYTHLDVLPRGEVAVAAIVTPGDGAQHAQLRRGQQSVGDRDPQHGRVGLNVQAVAQAQVFEFVVAEFAGEEAPRLVAKLRDALIDERPVHHIISIHSPLP